MLRCEICRGEHKSALLAGFVVFIDRRVKRRKMWQLFKQVLNFAKRCLLLYAKLQLRGVVFQLVVCDLEDFFW